MTTADECRADDELRIAWLKNLGEVLVFVDEDSPAGIEARRELAHVVTSGELSRELWNCAGLLELLYSEGWFEQ